MAVIRCWKLLPCIFCLLLLVTPVHAAGAKEIIYQTNFSVDPWWTTNNPSVYYCDADLGMYHYFVAGATNGYAYKKVFYDDDSFILEFDIMQVRTDDGAAMRFGLADSDMDITERCIVYSKFERGKYGNLFHIAAITQAGNLVDVKSQRYSYGGPTAYFAENVTYHVLLMYDKEEKTVRKKVTFASNHTCVWDHTVVIGHYFSGLDRICFSSVGDYGHANCVAEGYIDNVVLYKVKTPATTPATTPAEAPPATTAPPPVGTGSPVATTTAAAETPLPPYAAPLALATGAAAMLARGRRGV